MKLFRTILFAAAVALVPLLISGLQSNTAFAASTASTLTPGASVTSRSTSVQGQPVGEVLVGDQVAVRFRVASGGFTPAQRAEIVAARLGAFIRQGYTWRDVTVGQQHGETALLMGNNLLVTANTGEARFNQSNVMQLAYEWQGSTQLALQHANLGPAVSQDNTGIMPAGLMSATEAVPIQNDQDQADRNRNRDRNRDRDRNENQWPDWSRTSTKIVPVVALGTPGANLGAAQVTGPADRVDRVRAVLELDLVFQRAARVRVFIPSSNLTSVNRVEGTAVTALLQYRLFRF